MYRTHHCGELRITDCGKKVVLSGWVHHKRDLGGMTFIDLRDRYGKTQLVFNMETQAELCNRARQLGREYVIRVEGMVAERASKNPNIPTGDIEIIVENLEVLNPSRIPPFTIETQTDGGEELRMKYRYLDIRREPVKNNLILRHKMAKETRNYLDSQGFIEIETPALIKSTPEGARDFLVPSRLNPGEFYALPQSPQTFKQLLMVAGMDKYYQLVKCFRDEDFRADRQPEFTQIDCEMSFVERNDVLRTFEGLARHLFKTVLNLDMGDIPVMSYSDALNLYGTDKPDLRFEMTFKDLTHLAKGKGFKVFDEAEWIGAIVVPGCANYSRRQLDELTEFVKKPQIGARGLIYIKVQDDGTIKSSIDKFYSSEELAQWCKFMQASRGDLILILAGELNSTRTALSELRLEMGNRLNLRPRDSFKALWIVDFPLLEWDEETRRYYAMHHPFTAPMQEDIPLLDSEPDKVRANAYDFVINGVEIGGGSIRIHNRELQKKIFNILGFSDEEAQAQFGFLMNAFEYGAPPHGGIAFGFDRWVTLFGKGDSIRDFIAFPKNNAGRDIMINSPAPVHEEQLKELHLQIIKNL